MKWPTKLAVGTLKTTSWEENLRNIWSSLVQLYMLRLKVSQMNRVVSGSHLEWTDKEKRWAKQQLLTESESERSEKQLQTRKEWNIYDRLDQWFCMTMCFCSTSCARSAPWSEFNWFRTERVLSRVFLIFEGLRAAKVFVVFGRYVSSGWLYVSCIYGPLLGVLSAV